MTKVVLDVWGGESHTDHVARYMVALEAALPQITSEVKAGFLVNIREEAEWGSEANFDERVAL